MHILELKEYFNSNFSQVCWIHKPVNIFLQWVTSALSFVPTETCHKKKKSSPVPFAGTLLKMGFKEAVSTCFFFSFHLFAPFSFLSFTLIFMQRLEALIGGQQKSSIDNWYLNCWENLCSYPNDHIVIIFIRWN